jgi:hypothetical protein
MHPWVAYSVQTYRGGKNFGQFISHKNLGRIVAKMKFILRMIPSVDQPESND